MERTLFHDRFADLASLDDEDEQALGTLPMERYAVPRRQQIVARGTRTDFVFTILSGWAARYELRGDGSRRITGFLLPGDFCGIHAICGGATDHALVAITDCEVGRIDGDAMARLAQGSPAINCAIWRAKLVEEAALRKWLLYATDAKRGIAHLLCELYVRALKVGLAAGGRCRLPLTQEEIGDAMGITAVHTNRVVKRLRADGLVEIAHGELTIKDGEGLREAAEFDCSYLQPWQAREAVDHTLTRSAGGGRQASGACPRRPVFANRDASLIASPLGTDPPGRPIAGGARLPSPARSATHRAHDPPDPLAE